MNFLDFDMYSKRIGLFYQSKEKIGSLFGFILTMIYIIASLSLFFIYALDIVEHKTFFVHDSTIYPREAPSIELDNNLFYFAFGIEPASGPARFIDNTIYYPRIHFFDKIKEGDNMKTLYEEELKAERCNETKFGEEYRSLLVSGELSNSYCVENINLTLKGGNKYDKISYIQIGIYPCVNTSENKNHCKSQDIIDKYLARAYFTVLTKDIGLDPSNYTNPLIPTFRDVYTTIDKAFFRDFILYFGITEVQTDEGLFKEQIKTQKILQYRKELKSFYFRDESHYYNGSTMCNVQLRLGDDIRVQKRNYNKMIEVFSTTGGYMQLISTVFTIITLLTNKFQYEFKLVNSLFNFYPNKRKISVKREFSKLFDFLDSSNYDKHLFNYPANKMHKTEISHNCTNNIMINHLNKNSSSIVVEHENIKKYNKNNDKPILNLNDSAKNGEEYKNNEDNKSNNKSKIAFLPCEVEINSPYINNIDNRINIIKKNDLKHSDYIVDKKITLSDNYLAKNININLFYYYCFSTCRRDKNDIKLFNTSISFYRKKMDIIHLFNIILLIEKYASKNESKIPNS